HGCIFTRGPKDLKNSAVFVGGADIAAGEQLLAAATKAMFKPFTVSAMLDSNGSNTTAVAAVAKMVQAAGDVRGKRVLIVAGTGPVGIRAAGLFARAGADVCITSRKAEAGERARDLVLKRFGGTVGAIAMPDARDAIKACEHAALLLNAGPAGVMLVPKQVWANRPGSWPSSRPPAPSTSSPARPGTGCRSRGCRPPPRKICALPFWRRRGRPAALAASADSCARWRAPLCRSCSRPAWCTSPPCPRTA